MNEDFHRTPLENWKGQDDRRLRPGVGTPDTTQLHPEQPAVEPRDAGVSRSALHPVETPPPSPYARTLEDRLQALDDFGGRIASMEEGDFGDWMRRANLYWWKLVEALQGCDLETRRSLGEIQRIIQFNPSFMVQETRRRVIDLTLAIREHLGGRDDLTPPDLGVDQAGHSDEEGAPEYSARLKNPKPAKIGPVLEGGDQGFIGKG